MRSSVLLLLVASSLPAQYFDFAVTNDGRLYFSTPLTTGNDNSRSKVYRLVNDRLELFATGTNDDNPFGNTASAPLVSGDGSITGWALTYPCSSGSCGLAGLPRTFYQLQGAGIDTLTANNVQISRNGRFLGVSTFDGHARRIELPSLRDADLGERLALAGQQSVADTGAVLMLALNPTTSLIYRAADGGSRPVPGSEGALAASLSPAGDRIAFERNRDGRYELVFGDTVLATAPWPNAFRYLPSFANDGALLYLDPDGRPMIVPPGGSPRPLTAVDHVRRAILSGDGRLAWLATQSGQLLRVHTADDAVDEVIPATPYLAPGGIFAYPGSVVRFNGSGVTRATRFQVGDTTLPISAFGDEIAYVQVPWEYPAATAARALIVQDPASPFHQRFDFSTLDRPTIWFERDGPSLKAAHQDFRGILSASDPARPGETIHVYARNMGPVDLPVATGEPSPDPPARVTTPMACYLFELDAATNTPSHAVGLVVPFAGLSPGLVGVYHIDVIIPADWTAKQSFLQCLMDVGAGDNLFRGDSARLDVDAGLR